MRMLPLQKLLSRYGWMGVFTAAATPIPDDIVYIPLGLAKYSPVKFASALSVGKFILGGVIVVISIYFGRPFIEYLIAETSNPISLIIIAATTIAIIVLTIYYFIKIDWGKIIGKWFPWTLEKDKSSDEDGRENRE